MFPNQSYTSEETSRFKDAIEKIENFCKEHIFPKMRTGEVLVATIPEKQLELTLRYPSEVEVTIGNKTLGFQMTIIDRFLYREPITSDLAMCKDVILNWQALKKQLVREIQEREKVLKIIQNFQP